MHTGTSTLAAGRMFTWGLYKKLEATTGVEPVDTGFADPRLNHLATSPRLEGSATGLFGAGDGIRTRDIQLGKLTLYH